MSYIYTILSSIERWRARRAAFLGIVAALLSITAAATAFADPAWPARPLRMIVPYPAGGATDVVARLVGAHMSKTLGQQIVIENRAGADGNIGAAAAARAEPDGYTMAMVLDLFAVNPSLHKDLPFDARRDFTPIALIGRTPLVLVVHPSLHIASLDTLTARLKEKPESVSFASIGAGSRNRLAAEVYMARAGVKMLHVPYRGGGPAINDLVGGQVGAMFLSTTSSLPFIRDGKLIALAACSSTRLPDLPDLPTTAELGIPDLVAENWYGLLVPAGTPPAVAEKLRHAAAAAVSDPQTKARFAELGIIPDLREGPAFSAFLEAEMTKWSAVIKDADIRLD